MYHQQSFITLDKFYEMKPLAKLESVLSIADFSLLEADYPIDYHRRGPKGYSTKQLLSVLPAMQTEQKVNLKGLIQKLKTNSMFKRSCGFDYLDSTPSEATLNRFITQLSDTDILERTYRRMIYKSKTLGFIDGENVTVDVSKITAYEHGVPKKYISENDTEIPYWGGKLDTNGNFIKWFGWKMHALVDSSSGIPQDYIISPANIADIDMAEPLINKLMEDMIRNSLQSISLICITRFM